MSLALSIEQTIYTKLIEKHGENVLSNIDKNESLIVSGLFDSLDFISMLMELENKYNVDIDFEDADPTEFTTIRGLVTFLSEASDV